MSDHPPSIVSVSGNGRVSKPPDMAELSVGINLVRGTVSAATDDATRLSQELVDALQASGVRQTDLQTSNLSVAPEYDHQQRPARLIGYRIDNTLRVTIRDITAVPDVLAEATEAGGDAVTIRGITFSHSDPGALLAEARELAWNEARFSARQLAQLAGRPLGPATRIAEGPTMSAGGPRPMMRAAVAEAMPIESGTIEESIDLIVDFELG